MPTSEEARDWLAHAIANNELAHYGVEGMHWGIRKDIPSSGRNRSSTSTTPRSITKTAIKPAPKKVALHPDKDTKMSKDEQVALGIVGGYAVVFGAAYGAPAIHNTASRVGAVLYQDTIVKDLEAIAKNTANVDVAKDFLKNEANTQVPVGTVFHRVASYKETEVNGPKYATYLQDDVLRYRNTWITPGRSPLNKHYVTGMTALKDVNIASPSSVERAIAENLHNKLPDGETLLDKYLKANNIIASPAGREEYKKYPGIAASKIIKHNQFNVWGDDVGAGTSYWMQKAGYAAVTDINNTGSQARKHAVIVLDKSAFKVESRLLTQSERTAARIAISKISKGVPVNTQSKTAARIAKIAAKTVIKRRL